MDIFGFDLKEIFLRPSPSQKEHGKKSGMMEKPMCP